MRKPRCREFKCFGQGHRVSGGEGISNPYSLGNKLQQEEISEENLEDSLQIGEKNLILFVGKFYLLALVKET